jgi:hypothetical protein
VSQWSTNSSLALCLVVAACTSTAKEREVSRAAIADAATEGAVDPASEVVWTLGKVEVDTRDIYSDEEVEHNWIARLLNATHWATRESVVRREFWVAPGETFRAADVAELERNLRATGLFREVSVRLVPRSVPGDEGAGTEGVVNEPTGGADPSSTPAVADVIIETEDRLSISIGASGSFVGAVSSLGTTISESNLFGMGDRIAIGYSENSEDEFRGALSYRDRHFLGSWVTASAQIGRTEDGDFGGLGFERPFKHLADDESWRIAAATNETSVDYYDSGDVVAEVPVSRDAFDASVSRRFGTPEESWTVGLRAQHDRSDLDAARGPGAAAIDVPGDIEATFAGLAFGHRSIFGFREVQGLDTLGYVQDLQLSADFDALIGPTFRSEEGEDDTTQPTLGLNTHLALEPFHDTFVSLAANGRGRTNEGDLQGWALGFDLTAYELALRPHTLAAHLSFDEAYEGEGLPIQLTLGEDQGLRGYPSQEFTGERVMTLNFEDRIDLEARIGTVQFGAVVFFDVGWIEDRGEGFGAPLRSAGFGLRLGSDALLGSRVVRIDLSFPLDDFEGEEFDPLVSVSLGQVFTFR